MSQCPDSDHGQSWPSGPLGCVVLVVGCVVARWLLIGLIQVISWILSCNP